MLSPNSRDNIQRSLAPTFIRRGVVCFLSASILIGCGCGRLGFDSPTDASLASVDARVNEDSATFIDASIPDADLLVWLRFDDPTIPGLDTLHTLEPGTCEDGGCPTMTNGIDGMALRFDGVDDALLYESVNALDFGERDQPFSISLWYRADDLTPPGQQVLMAQSRGQTQVSFQLAFENVQLEPELDLVWKVCESQCLSGSFATDPDVVELPAWTLIVGTWDGQTTRLYVNAAEIDSAEKDSINFDGSPLIIGADLEGGVLADFFRGSMDDFRITERVLSVAEQGQMILDAGFGL